MTGTDGLEFVVRPLEHEHAVGLLSAFYDEQVARYGFAESIEMNPSEFVPPDGVFAVAYRGGEAVGRGGWRWHGRAGRVAEIKKTYLVPPVRGIGAGRAMLAWLERDAVAAGAVQAVLETGVRNLAALSLFTSHGYQPIASYVPGRPPQINRAFTKPLTAI